METRQIDYRGSSIFYRLYGSGRPVVLVHGFGETGDVWKNQVEYLQRSFQLIVPDLPGSGRSQMIGDMSMEGMADVINTIVVTQSKEKSRAAGGSLPGRPDDSDRICMIGHSMGGYVTLAFAEKYGELLASFGLFHSTALADTEEKKATRRKGIGFVREHGAFEFLKTTTPNLFSPLTKQRFPELVSQFVQELSGFSPEALIAYYEGMIRRPDRTAILKQAKNPVLFVLGEHDNAVPIQDGLKQSHLPSQAHIHILHDSGHMGMLEEKDKSNQLLEAFLTQS